MFDFLVSYATLGIAIALFVALLLMFIMKREKLLKSQKALLLVTLGLLTVYFAFLILLVIGFGQPPSRTPVPHPI